MTRHIVWQAMLALVGIVLIFIVLFQVVSSVPPQESVSLAPVTGGTYVEGVLGYWEKINPILAPVMAPSNPAEKDLSTLVFEGLTILGEKGEILPWLATEWEMSDDGLVYEFKLRQDVNWHDGAPLTAADVAFTVQAIQDPGYQGDDNLAALWRNVTVETLDNQTVRFSLAEPFPSFLYYTTIGLLPAHLLGSVAAEDLPYSTFSTQQPVGTGAFRVESALPDRVVLAANDDYWADRSNLDRLEFWFYDDWDGLLTDYQRGDVHGFHPLDAQPLSALVGQPDLQLYTAQSAGYGIVFFNLKRESRPFFQEKEVRQGLLYALDRQKLIDEVLDGQGLVADSPIPPISWAYDPTVRQYSHDPERAIGLLDAAGWLDSNGDRIRDKGGVDLTFTLLASDDPVMVRLAEEMARQWLAVGINVNVRAVSTDSANHFVHTRNFDAALTRITLTADPDPYSLWHSTQAESGQNFSGFANEQADVVLEEARSTADSERRAELYQIFQQTFVEEVPSLLIYYPLYTYAVDALVREVQLGPLLDASQRFQTVKDWYLQSEPVVVNTEDEFDKSGD